MPDFRILSSDDVQSLLTKAPHPSRRAYYAMYSSWYDGIVTDPELMTVPIDDHIVHRGDGVFEAIKCVNSRIYALDRHLERLMISAEKIGLVAPFTLSEIREICIKTTQAAKNPDCLLRLYVSRGPGGFTTNPYECIASQLYLVVTAFRPASPQKYNFGATAATSLFRVKEGFLATVKSCNYLPNVLMKKEAVDRGVDFTISIDENGSYAEGSTENFAIVDSQGKLVISGFDRTLRGITAVRASELAKVLIDRGELYSVQTQAITSAQVQNAREMCMFGTTIDAMPICTFDGRAIGDGKPGLVVRSLTQLFNDDIRSGPLSQPVG